MYIEGNTLILGGSSYLEHHGILGQKWGVRRFQNKDGTRTAAGKARDQKNAVKTIKNAKQFRASASRFKGTSFGKGADKRALKEEKTYRDMAFDILNNGKNKDKYNDLSRDIDATSSFEYEEYSKKRDAMIEINARISLEGSGIKNPSNEAVAEEWVYWADFDEDWGAGAKGNSYDRYLVSKGYNPNEIHKRFREDYEKLYDLASKDAEEHLGPYGDTKIQYYDPYTRKNVKRTAKEELTSKLVDEATLWIDDYGASERANIVYTDKELSDMRAEDAKYSPLKHSAFFVEDGTLYLSHHGVKGMHWGVHKSPDQPTSSGGGGAQEEDDLNEIDKILDSVKNQNGSSASYDSEHLDHLVESALHAAQKADNPREADLLKKKAKAIQELSKRVKKTESNVKDALQHSSLSHHGIKHTSIGGSMYVENKKLILGDSSYLEHHGIKGQRWGVRRFQNRDGSLTSAGRKRLGYAANTAGDALKKTFKAGVKVGTAVGKAGVMASVAAAKGAKSLHESSKAKRIEKKKQKVSKTRSGVYANKDLFSMEELRSLNAKFDEQDKLKMDKLKKGMEIAKFVAAYAGAVKGVGDAYQSVTGENMLKTVTTMKEKKKTAAEKVSTDKNEAKKRLQENIDRYRKAKEEEGRKIAKNKKLQQYIDMYDLDKQQRDAEEAARKLLKNYKLQQYIDQYNASLTHDALRIQNGRKYMQHYVKNGTLFINAGEPYLEHHGVKGMKWGKHLMAGKGEAGAGGGAGEDDEKLKEMAEKAGMTIAEYKAKIGGKLGAAKDKIANAIGNVTSDASHQTEDAAKKKKAVSQYSSSERNSEYDYASARNDTLKSLENSNKQHKVSKLIRGSERSARLAEGYYRSALDKSRQYSNKVDDLRSGIGRTVDTLNKTLNTAERQSRIAYKKKGSDKERYARLAEGSYRSADALAKQYQKQREQAREIDAYAASVTGGSRSINVNDKPTSGVYKRKPAKKKSKARHFDGSDSVYTEGTKLVINSKWG